MTMKTTFIYNNQEIEKDELENEIGCIYLDYCEAMVERYREESEETYHEILLPNGMLVTVINEDSEDEF